MSNDKPIIPLNAAGQPDLSALVQQCGGYHLITPQMWEAWDDANEQFQKRLRHFGSDVDELLSQLPTPEPSPFEACVTCESEGRETEGHFGYRNASGELKWYCRAHRLGVWWADKRR